MEQAIRRTSFYDRMLAVPDHVPKDMERYYVYWKVFYALAGLGHLFSLQMFWQTGVYFMVYFNIFSVLLFIGASILLRLGYYRTAYWGAITELVLHGIAATLCVGPSYSFQNFVFLVLVLIFIQPFYSMAISMLLAAVTLTISGVLMYYAVTNPPVYVIPESMATSLMVMPMVTWPIFLLAMVLPFVRASARAEREVAAAFGESERLLRNILPEPIARRLKSTEGMIADDFERVAILFVDIVGFTQMSQRLQPADVVSMLNDVFNGIDDLVEKYGVEKIKTIGDAYMVVAGVPTPIADPDDTIARLALDIQAAVSHFKEPGSGRPVRVRIGINSGKVVAGVIGQRKFAYDLWGDAVNVAARMESTSAEGRIQVTSDFAAGLEDRFTFEPRGEIEVKGKGKLTTCYLTGVKRP